MSLTTYTRSVEVAAPIGTAFAFCNSVAGFRKIFPGPVEWFGGPQVWGPDDVIEMRFLFCGVWVRYRAEIVAWERDRLFVDEQRRGPYREFRHTHRFEPIEGGTRCTDHLEFRSGYGRLYDRTIGLWLVRSLFRKRHARLKAALESAA
jgi:ligand-binding SRPBCC domain-containing protein